MRVLNRERGQIYAGAGPISLTNETDDTITYPTTNSPELIDALNQFIFDPDLEEGEEISLDGHVIAHFTNGRVV